MWPFLNDMRHAIRSVGSRPGLATLALLSLVLGIAPPVVVFSVIDAAGFRPLPITDPGNLVGLYASTKSGPHQPMTDEEYGALRERQSSFSSVAASTASGVGLSGDGHPAEVVLAAGVSGTYFSTLGVRPAVGRVIAPSDDRATSAPVIVISHRLWTRRFDAAPDVVGRTVRVNDRTCQIVGVAPAGFRGTAPILAPQVWIPLGLDGPDTRDATTPGRRLSRRLTVVARLHDGVSLRQARAELAGIGRQLAAAWPESNRDRSLDAEYEQVVRRRLPAAVGSVALGVVGLLLLTACANVAGLLVGRAEARREEIAVRLALGAGRWRLVRQLLAEGLVLSVLAAGSALLVSLWLIRLLPGLIPSLPLSLDFDLRLDARLMLFALAVAVGSVPLFALAPALVASRADLTPVLKGRVPRLGRWRPLTLRNLLVVSQVAVTVVLLVALGLLVRGFVASRSVDPGFSRRPMLYATLAPEAAGYDAPRVREFYARLVTRLRATPGIERVALTRHVPLNSLYGGGAGHRIAIPGRPAAPGPAPDFVRSTVIDPEFLPAIGTPVVRGRNFWETDGPASARVALVNEKMAATYWPAGDAVGRTLWLLSESGARQEATVVGVVRDAKYFSLSERPEPHLYLPYSQHPTGEMTVLVRVSRDERSMAVTFRQVIESLDPSVPALQVMTFAEHMRLAVFFERTATEGTAVLGIVGLLLSGIGLHGVVAFVVARRTRDLGIRMALGATPRDVFRHVAVQGGRLVLAGMIIGLASAVGVAKVLASSVYGVRMADPAAFLGAAAVVAIASAAATWVPARRAARLEPVATFRET